MTFFPPSYTRLLLHGNVMTTVTNGSFRRTSINWNWITCLWYLVVNTSIHVIGGPACIYLIGVYRHEIVLKVLHIWRSIMYSQTSESQISIGWMRHGYLKLSWKSLVQYVLILKFIHEFDCFISIYASIKSCSY